LTILIKKAILGKERKNIYIEENRIVEVGGPDVEAEYVIDGEGLAALPGFVNTHTHSAMTLFRGYADDIELKSWLKDHIWPAEAKMNEEAVYWGSKLACLEMIKSGTTCFSDMYWHINGTARAAYEMGLRAVLAPVFIDKFESKNPGEETREFQKKISEYEKCERITLALGPHAIYTVTEDSLIWFAEYAKRKEMTIHTHLAETQDEVIECRREFGKSPVEYLSDIGFLGDNVIVAHSIWVSESDAVILGEKGVKVAHCPTSNMKLASGAFDFQMLRRNGVSISLGTDGCGSNNNLDMFESMKIAALLQKHAFRDTTRLTAYEAYDMATVQGASALGIDCGKIEEGLLADIALIDMRTPALCPSHNQTSDIVYSANGDCVDTLICDGKILMRGRCVEGEEEIIECSKKAAQKLFEQDGD
jgi:5-methylthioadenosine/S-adenosylhomocysteine deaminase